MMHAGVIRGRGLCRRCYKGARSVRYYRCQADMFAYYGEFARWDGLTERITLYEVATLSRFPMNLLPVFFTND